LTPLALFPHKRVSEIVVVFEEEIGYQIIIMWRETEEAFIILPWLQLPIIPM
jgi:hypothetical protein